MLFYVGTDLSVHLLMTQRFAKIIIPMKWRTRVPTMSSYKVKQRLNRKCLTSYSTVVTVSSDLTLNKIGSFDFCWTVHHCDN